jgi:membrane protein implicated in regulation of membrane protease activity
VPDFITDASAFTVFLGIAGFGFLVLLISLVFGELFDLFDGDHDFDHGGPGFLSSRVLSVFVTAFGGFGAIATQYGLGVLPASGVGFLSGAVFASLIYGFGRLLYSQQASTQVTSADLVGRPARVVVSIPANGVGQIRVQIGEEVLDKVARSQSGAAITENSIVKIEEALGEVVLVSPQ